MLQFNSRSHHDNESVCQVALFCFLSYNKIENFMDEQKLKSHLHLTGQITAVKNENEHVATLKTPNSCTFFTHAFSFKCSLSSYNP